MGLYMAEVFLACTTSNNNVQAPQKELFNDQRDICIIHQLFEQNLHYNVCIVGTQVSLSMT